MATNDILKYTSKDYNSIFEDVISIIPSLTDTWTNTEDGDPGIVLVKLMSALGDMLSYNMDKQALEYYSSTVTQRKNAMKLFNLIGYKMHWYKSATNTITVTNNIEIPENYYYVDSYEEMIARQQRAIQEEIDRMGHEDDGNAAIRKTERANWLISYTNDFPYEEPQYEDYYPPNYDISQINYENPILTPEEAITELYQYIRTEKTNYMNVNTITINRYIADITRNLGVYGDGSSNNSYLVVPSTNPEDVVYITPQHSQDIKVIEGRLLSTTFNSNMLRDNRYYFVDSAIDEDNIFVSYRQTDSQTQEPEIFIDKVDNLMTVTNSDMCFQFGVDEFDMPYIEFPNYYASRLLTNTTNSTGQTSQVIDSVEFKVYYVATRGVFGNITKNYLNRISNITNISASKYTITHPANTDAFIDENGYLLATPGQNPETAREAYKNSINFVTTFNTLVTLYDFERFCKRQPTISNAFSVDGQRATDIANAVKKEADSMSLVQLQSCLHTDDEDIAKLRNIYCNRKEVQYNEANPVYGDKAPVTQFKKYGLNLHVVYGNFDTLAESVSGDTFVQATMKQYTDKFWAYSLESNYAVQNNIDNEEVRIDNISETGGVAKYLDKLLREYQIINVQTEYATVRVFPWRCCGVLHLMHPVTPKVAETVIESVINHLSVVFHPSKIEFGAKINYMDIIEAVVESNDLIQYFDAGLGMRKLMDIDKSVDDSYFNATSLYYYVQTMHSENRYSGMSALLGNEDEYVLGSIERNPYYKLLSIAPEYILKE